MCGEITHGCRGPALSSGARSSVQGPRPGSRGRSKAQGRAEPSPPAADLPVRAARRGPATVSPPGCSEGTNRARQRSPPPPPLRSNSGRRGCQPGSAHTPPPGHVTAEPRPGGGLCCGIRKGTGWCGNVLICGNFSPVTPRSLRGERSRPQFRWVDCELKDRGGFDRYHTPLISRYLPPEGVSAASLSSSIAHPQRPFYA